MSADKKTVLVVDDAPENIDVLAGLLKQTYKVKVAKDGAKALQIARKAPPDVILLDVLMPGMDGYEVCQELKADDTTSATPVIFCSGLTSEDERAKGIALGARGYVNKPVNPDEVFAAIEDALSA